MAKLTFDLLFCSYYFYCHVSIIIIALVIIIIIIITTTTAIIVIIIIINIFIIIIIIMFVLQEGKGSPAGTSMESSGSNQAGFRFHDLPAMQTTHAEQPLLLPSTIDPSARFDAGLDQAVADDEQKVAHLKVMR